MSGRSGSSLETERRITKYAPRVLQHSYSLFGNLFFFIEKKFLCCQWDEPDYGTAEPMKTDGWS